MPAARQQLDVLGRGVGGEREHRHLGRRARGSRPPASSPPMTGMRRSSRTASKDSRLIASTAAWPCSTSTVRHAEALELHADQAAQRGVVLGDQHLARDQRGRGREAHLGRGLAGLQRQLERERRALAELGDDGDVAAHRAGEPARDAEAQPGARPRPRVVARPRLEQAREIVLGDAAAGVGDRDLSLSPSTCASIARDAALRVLDRVGGEVEDDLAHAGGVAAQRVGHVGVDVDEQLERRGRAGSGAARRRSRSAGGAGRSRRPRSRSRPASARVTSSTSRTARPSDCAASEITSASSRSRVRQPALAQQLGRARDARQRRLDLVAHRRQEAALLLLGELEVRDVAERPQAPGRRRRAGRGRSRRAARRRTRSGTKRTGSPGSAISRSCAIAALRVGEQRRSARPSTRRAPGRSARSGARSGPAASSLLVDDRDPAGLRRPSGSRRARPRRAPSSCVGEPAARVLGGARAGDVAAGDLDRDRAAAAEAQRRLALDPAPSCRRCARRRSSMIRCAARPGRRRRARRAATGTSSGCVSARHRRPMTSSWRRPSAARSDGLAYSISPWPSNIHTRSGESSTSVRDARGRSAPWPRPR